ncbi:MAG: hypothetical protein ACRC78_18325 [Planktothrix sp.]
MELKILKETKEGKLVSPIQNSQWKLNKWYHCTDFDASLDVACSNGFYSVEVEGLPYIFRKDNPAQKVFVVENSGKSVIFDIFKRRFEKQKIIREISHQEIWDLAKAKEPELGYKLSEVIFPINPLDFEPKITVEEARKLLAEWSSVVPSVRASIRASIRDSIRDSVVDSIRDSVVDSIRASVVDSIRDSVVDSIWASVVDSIWASVVDSIWASIWASVGAYASSLFFSPTDNPLQSGADLWVNGYIPFMDKNEWRLYTKNGVVIQ